jgi:hypothetical protein
MKIFFFSIALLISSLNAFAGDYLLTISDNPDSACALEAKKRGDEFGHPVCSIQEITADLERHFTGKETKLEIFKGAFTNARIKFCTTESRHPVLIAIVNALAIPDIVNEWDAYDYLYMLGTLRILNEIKDRLHNEQSVIKRKRLQRAKKSVERGLKDRHVI